MATNQQRSLSLRLHHFGISVANLEETVAWYTDKLGFAPLYRYEIPQARVAFLGRDSIRVEIFEVTNSEPMPQSQRNLATDQLVQGLKHIAFQVDELDATMGELKARGVQFVTDALNVPNSDGERFAFFHDNNGILMELYQPRLDIDVAT